MFAAHHQLSNLIAIVDLNGQQAFGYTRQVLSMEPMAERWRAFGWDVIVTDGHDPLGLSDVMLRLNTSSGPPHAIIARTVFGKGVSFMEGQIKWHYWPMSQAEYFQASSEIAQLP
jgi:transketolase